MVTAAQAYTYQAEVLDIHDGDTVKFAVPLDKAPKWRKPKNLGFHVHIENGYYRLHAPMRFLGLNAPELATPEGKAARDYLCSLIKVGDVLTVRSSVSTHEIDPDKYGDRWDAVLVRADGMNINDQMVSSGHAKAWDGTGSKPT